MKNHSIKPFLVWVSLFLGMAILLTACAAYRSSTGRFACHDSFRSPDKAMT